MAANLSVAVKKIEKQELFVELRIFPLWNPTKKLILLDIQGSGANLYDPEVASLPLELRDDGEIYCFVQEIFPKMAIDTFIAFHACNKYCELLELQKL
jgi:hypothetical protein